MFREARSHWGSFRKLIAAAAIAAAGAGCGGGGERGARPAGATPVVEKVARCAAGDRPESGLQGQVPMAARVDGFKGFHCNLTLVGQVRGEGGSWSSASFTDNNGNRCLYHAKLHPVDRDGQELGLASPGVPVIDITDSRNPVVTAHLTTTAMLDPWESLRLNVRRQVLAATDGANSGGSSEVNFYDLSGDCRYPQLLSSVKVGTGADGGIIPEVPMKGHEGNFSPDGRTFYVGEGANPHYYAIDITDLTRPRMVATFDNSKTDLGTRSVKYTAYPGLGAASHGVSVSADGTRGYFVIIGTPNAQIDLHDEDAPTINGFAIVDLTEVRDRKPNPTIKLISTTGVRDGSFAQHTVPFLVDGRPHMLFVDENGSAGPGGFKAACAANLTPFPKANIYDISDERSPQLLSKLMLEAGAPENCNLVEPDVVASRGGAAIYGSHYCSVDNRENTTAIACGYWNSGIRVFDVRNPARPREIAYYNPAGTVDRSPASRNQAWEPGGPDYCVSHIDFDFDRRELSTMCMDNGALVLKFAEGVWPMKESTRGAGGSY